MSSSSLQAIPHIILSTIDHLPYPSQLFKSKQQQTTNYRIIFVRATLIPKDKATPTELQQGEL
jgi:hypothetical protein